MVLSFLACLIFGLSCQNDPIVNITQGSLRGTEQVTTLSGRPFYSFRGIPYAKPPIGELRFRPPLPSGNWDGIYDATKDANICTQLGFGEEDCLYLNVYTPMLPSNATSLLPVMVFIHGGTFLSGGIWSFFYGPDYFMEKNVVIVLIAYRLGAFGFLSTGDAAAPGNFGLLDQALALQWVHDNSASFGGDPARVLLFGNSAGAACVAFHIVANVQPSSGLFHAAITQSGTVMDDWAFQPDPHKWAVALGKQLQCPSNSSNLLIKCLQDKSAAEILSASNAIGVYENLIFLPVIEDPEFGNFITKQPLDILKSGNFNKVPIISGVNKDDGLYLYPRAQRYLAAGTINDAVIDEMLPELLSFIPIYNTSSLVNVSNAVKTEYFDKIDLNNRTQVIRTVIDLCSDFGFNAGTNQFVRAMSANLLPAYMYVFGYAGSISQNSYSGEREVGHGEEGVYFFYITGLHLNNDDLRISKALVNMWVNFATNLNPNPIEGATWIPTSNDSIQYLRIQNEFSMQSGYRTKQMDFWNNYIPTIINI